MITCQELTPQSLNYPGNIRTSETPSSACGGLLGASEKVQLATGQSPVPKSMGPFPAHCDPSQHPCSLWYNHHDDRTMSPQGHVLFLLVYREM